MAQAPDWIAGDPAALRAWRLQTPEVLHPALPDGVRLTREHGDGIECRPIDPLTGGIVHFHGGGFCVGSPHTHRCVGAWIAHVLRRRLWLCPWPLAPEHVLPTQPAAAVERLEQAVARYGGDLVISGDSAGAAMALWAYAFAEPRLRARVRGVLLFYGYYGLLPKGGSETDGLGPKSTRAMMARLDPDGLWDKGFAPLEPDFRVARTTISIGAALDPLLGNSQALARAHPGIRSILAKDCGHGFLSAVRPSVRALEALGKAARWI